MSIVELQLIVVILCSYIGIKELIDRPRPINLPLALAGWIIGGWIR